MGIITIPSVSQHIPNHELLCPYFTIGTNTCLASIFFLIIDAGKAEDRCLSENWDDCPMVLSKLLRSKN